ncbi:NmrA family NAD(P)-binding protein [Auraticoccus monumenti]|uniref:NAD(P)H dehydrogenase (Quinone) n=1 Tax=Auraticoccus monumenti TaxID=675864 RepID=A0A1G6TRA7_9ACTN|nr:NAD(P)H-binding protein [Auraticoccus monumenti]SDD31444.1 NAD(P)H dehydrogenase (quinone) [Auraticoccus monumenti]
MSTILVTGATGRIGRMTLQHLLERRPAAELVGLARDPRKAADLTARGVEIRAGDYLDRASLTRALAGVEKVLLVPSVAFTDRSAQHANVIAAAQEVGVDHLVYTPIIRKAGSGLDLPHVTAHDTANLETLEASGLTSTILGHPPFLESLRDFIGADAAEVGVRVPAGDGRVAAATRQDLAEAQAVVLTERGHEGRTYALHGAPAVSFSDVAEVLSEIRGTTVHHVPVPDEEYLGRLVAGGLPGPAAEFVLSWVRAINTGEWDDQPGDLERLLGRSPTTITELLRDHPTTAR